MKYQYKIGEKVIVIRQICGHGFDIGEIATISNQSSHSDFFEASNGKERWYISIEEIFPYEIIKQRILEEIKNERS